MKRSDVLAVIAILAIITIALVWNAYVFFALLLFLPFVAWRVWKKKDSGDKYQVPKSLTLDEVKAQYGEPDNSIVVDPTKANELSGCILVFTKGRILVVAGEPVMMDDIMDVTTVNTATPYTFGQYQVVFKTKKPDREYIRVDVGMDAEWAMNVATEVLDSMKK